MCGFLCAFSRNVSWRNLSLRRALRWHPVLYGPMINTRVRIESSISWIGPRTLDPPYWWQCLYRSVTLSATTTAHAGHVLSTSPRAFDACRSGQACIAAARRPYALLSTGWTYRRNKYSRASGSVARSSTSPRDSRARCAASTAWPTFRILIPFGDRLVPRLL